MIKLFAVIFPILLAIDLTWLGFIMNGFYKRELGSLARLQNGAFVPVWWAGIAVYVLIAIGLVMFVKPLVATMPPLKAFATGAMFGLVLYGLYDLTNYSTLNNWSLKLVAADIVWGMVLMGAFAVFIRFLVSKGW